MAYYNYWDDLKTDIRKPNSWLDFQNMILRRLLLIRVIHYSEDRAPYYQIHYWPRFCRECVVDYDGS